MADVLTRAIVEKHCAFRERSLASSSVTTHCNRRADRSQNAREILARMSGGFTGRNFRRHLLLTSTANRNAELLKRGVSDHVAGRRLGSQAAISGGRSRHGTAVGDRSGSGATRRAA